MFAQCFDELIRQITINCAERGFLLVRVRDEIKMTIQAYQTLYESSIAYGMRKALMAEQRKNEMQATIKTLEDSCEELQIKNKELEKEIEDINKRDEEERERDKVLDAYCYTPDPDDFEVSTMAVVPTKRGILAVLNAWARFDND